MALQFNRPGFKTYPLAPEIGKIPIHYSFQTRDQQTKSGRIESNSYGADTISNIDESPRNSYQMFLHAEASQIGITPNVTEISGDIFEIDTKTSLAHCVSEDFKMSKGIAFKFRRKYGKINELRRQQKSLTEVASIKTENHYVFYLITKRSIWQKSSYEDLFKCLQNLKEICIKLQVTKLACHRLGCGLDSLK